MSDRHGVEWSTDQSRWSWSRVPGSIENDYAGGIEWLSVRYELLLDAGAVAVLAFPTPAAALELFTNRLTQAPPLRWASVLLDGFPSLTLSPADDQPAAAALAWLTPFDEPAWEALFGTQLPQLEDGPIRLTFPPIPPDRLPGRGRGTPRRER